MNFPSWFIEAAQKRLEEISVQSQRDQFIRMERDKLAQIFHALMGELSEEMKIRLLEVEESWTSLESLEKEWIYMQGVRDGGQLVLPLFCKEIEHSH